MNTRLVSARSSAPVWKSLLLGVALLLNAMLAFRLLWGPQSLVSYQGLAGQHATLLDQIAEMDSINAELSREIRLLQSDDRYVEKMIRRRLNFVRENEILYLFADSPADKALPDHEESRP